LIKTQVFLSEFFCFFEFDKFENTRTPYADEFEGGLLQCGLIGGGLKGLQGVISATCEMNE